MVWAESRQSVGQSVFRSVDRPSAKVIVAKTTVDSFREILCRALRATPREVPVDSLATACRLTRWQDVVRDEAGGSAGGYFRPVDSSDPRFALGPVSGGPFDCPGLFGKLDNLPRANNARSGSS